MFRRVFQDKKLAVVASRKLVTADDRRRIRLDGPGGAVWFESPDVELSPRIEVFLTALLFPALHRSQRLSSDQPVDAVLREGLETLSRTYSEWWSYQPGVADLLRPRDTSKEDRSDRVGICFSGGVDSFYSLLNHKDRVDALVFVHGFDIPLHDRLRWRHAEQQFRSVCREFHKQAIVVRTNLRQHSIFKRVCWNRSHGAALAAVGHALSDTIGTLMVPPSYRSDRLQPWGSDPRTDPLYSSSRLQVLHPPSRKGRMDRIRQVAGHPVVQRHLRVCYENRRPTGNCSRCEKCLSTMTTLAGLGLLERFEVFERSVLLAERLDSLPCIAHHAPAVWREIAELPHEPQVAAALDRLLCRAPPPRRSKWAVRWNRCWGTTRGRKVA